MIPFDIEDEDPQTQLHLAAMWGDLLHMKLAIRSGGNVNAKRDGSSPLHDACLHGQYFAAKFLMRLGADVDCLDDEGSTPLLNLDDEACVPLIARELLLRGANPNICNKNGDTAIQLAVYHDFPEIVELLLNYGAEDRRNIPCWEEKAMLDYSIAMEHRNSLFHDDRMFLLEVTPVTTRSLTTHSEEKKEWSVITRRNVPGYPPFRADRFSTKSEAIDYYKKAVVETPRVSLEKSPPDPKPSLEEYASWLKAENYYDPLLNPEARITKDK